MADPLRQLTIDLSDKPQTDWLQSGNFKLQISQDVQINGKLHTSTVWKTCRLAPYITTRWSAAYALNWALEAPKRDAEVTLSGKWFRCAAGQVVDVDEDGFFELSHDGEADPAGIKVRNRYVSDDPDGGIHLVVGVLGSGAADDWEVIFVDPARTATNASATLRPLDQVRWWFDAVGQEGGATFEKRTDADSADFSLPSADFKNFKRVSRYDTNTLKWTTTGIA